MKTLNLIFPVCILLFLGFSCNFKKIKSEDLSDLNLLQGDITLCGNGDFGEVSFSISCEEDVRKKFDLAISLLHSFEYSEAEKAFAQIIADDPDCAMAYWGVAMSNFHSLWLQSGTAYLEKGALALELARSLVRDEREKAYILALSKFYEDWETQSHQERAHRFELAMEKVYREFPDDKEAAIFYALALRATADPNDKTYKAQRKSGAILESIYPNQPDHPGIAHYIIHNYDYPELANLALATARKYAQIAPSSAHAQHMPSHIFTRLGLWEESINSNLNSTSSAICYAESIDPDGHWDEELHGMDYLVYAYLQKGETKKALEQLEYLKTFKKVFPENFKVAYTVAAIPSRIALETKDWILASNLEMPSIELNWEKFPWQESILYFARAMGSIRNGDVNQAKEELELLKANHEQLVRMKQIYESNQVQIQIKTVEAWISMFQGNQTEAVAMMRAAAEMEYHTNKHPVTPGEVLPAGELLGDLLMESKLPAEALIAYEYDLTQHPKRFNGLYGAAKAAELSGNHSLSISYFKQMIDLTNLNEIERKEIVEAKEFLAKN
ncbi:tetratricopeptide repeat protein [Algoriphagus pacificus]|uniref:Tetratricopeptide repeat-containing protein n=1 Tax=Algoriphagus pacificus TaxID=2811234 RepID=A0ABS3CLJ4_9BACT|nr:hypothetical protein [Algoriphagus pacificus]MBN7817051.1 hypothetical protein [Algoriphagus pacificus]